MTLIKYLLADGERSLTLFLHSAAIKAVEALLVEKNGKAYVKCQVRGKEVLAKPEEIIRQLWIHRLMAHYRYPVSRLQVEYPITFGRDTSKRADIVIMDADRPTVPYVIVEVKREKAKNGNEQLTSYTHATGAPLAMWSDGSQAIPWHRKNPHYFCLGPVSNAYRAVESHTRRRLRQWLCAKHRVRGMGTGRFSDAHLHDVLGLVRLTTRTRSFPWANP